MRPRFLTERILSRPTIVFAAVAILFGSQTGHAVAQTIGNCTAPISQSRLNVNNVNAAIYPHGGLFCCPSLYEQPAGSGLTPIFAGNIWFAGKVGDDIRAFVGRFGPSEQWAGPIFPGVQAPPNCDDFDRIYKIERDDLVRYENGAPASRDLKDWPTGLGAPTIDPNGLEIVVGADGVLRHVDSSGVTVWEEHLSFEDRLTRLIDLDVGERPKLRGDQMLWWISNDLGNAHLESGAQPVGMEVHGTAFAFDAPGTVGDLTFHSFRLLYKGLEPIKDAYIAVYIDSDLGVARDDYVGVDTTLGLGYSYNAIDEDGDYGAPAPAVGIDFFQGPVANLDGVDNDKDGEVDEVGERLQMTSFMRLFRRKTDGQPYEEDPLDTEEFYFVMQGRWIDGAPMTFGGNGRDFTTDVTTFQYPGKPEDRGYWTEINVDGSGTSNIESDRRFSVSSGPFNMDSGESEEIVFGFVFSTGDDHLDSVRKLREDDLLAQQLFDIGFEIAPLPAAPEVTATPLDGKIILEWENAPTSNNYLDGYRQLDKLLSPDIEDRDYVFEGYNVYQYSDTQDKEGKLLAVYDVANGVTRVIEGDPLTFVTADGGDNGVRHHHVMDGLTNYQTYHFGVQAYAYNAESGRKVYHGPISRLEVIPARPDNRNSGTSLTATEGEQIDPSFAGGNRDAEISASVVNPAVITGGSYTVDFRDLDGTMVFDIRLPETGETRFDGASYAAVHGRSPLVDPGAPPTAVNVDGLSFSVTAFADCRGGEFSDPNERLDFSRRPLQREFFSSNATDRLWPAPGTVVRFYSEPLQLFGDFDGDGAVDTVRAITEVAGPSGTDPCVDAATGNQCLNGERIVAGPFMSSSGLWTIPVRHPRNSVETLPGFAPTTYEIRFIDGLDVTWNGFTSGAPTEVPFQIWDIGPVAQGEENESSDDEQMAAVQFSDFGGECEFGWNERPDPIASGFGLSDRIYAFYLDSGQVYVDYYTDVVNSLGKPVKSGDSFTIETAHLAPETGSSDAFRIEEIGIVPNPYRGASAYEVSQQSDEVRFTNMPEQATIRVFDLAGSLIRVLEKNSPESYLRWDLLTDTGLPIGSGVYFVHVEVPNVGERALKFAAVRKRAQLPIAR